MTDLVTFDVPAVAFSVDRETRTIRGTLLPFGAISRPAFNHQTGQPGRFRFTADTHEIPDDPAQVVLNFGHDRSSLEYQIGVGKELEKTPAGVNVAFSIARTPEGDRVLTLAEDGVLKHFSAEVGGEFAPENEDGVTDSVATFLTGAAVVVHPAFEGAVITSVAASAAQNKEITMTVTPVEEAAPQTGADFSAITEAIAAGFANLAAPQARPEPVAAGASFEVREELPYRFDGIGGGHGFIEDLQLSANGDSAARQRLDTFMDVAFSVTGANVGALNVTQHRPELYVPNLQYTRPLWELVSTGSIEDKTPFTVPQFSSASGLAAAHVEDVEPTPGAFAATSQTVSPAPISGKVQIVREVWDQGGNPQTDGIVWGEMLNAYFELIEANIKTMLAGSATAELNLSSAVDQPLVAALTNYLAGLQFVRGGNRFSAFAADAKLFPALVSAKDGANRPLLPVTGPMNAQGEVDGSFDRVQIGAQVIRASWALSQGANTKSYNFVPSSVWYWASAPKRFTFEYQLKSVDMAIWGYGGGAILRASDVKPIDYDVSDA